MTGESNTRPIVSADSGPRFSTASWNWRAAAGPPSPAAPSAERQRHHRVAREGSRLGGIAVHLDREGEEELEPDRLLEIADRPRPVPPAKVDADVAGHPGEPEQQGLDEAELLGRRHRPIVVDQASA